jgi:exodeoxyribonuclease VII large subunit
MLLQSITLIVCLGSVPFQSPPILKDGDMVNIEGRVEYYVQRGSLNMIISKLDQCDNMGDIFKQFENMKQYFQNKGYFNNKLTIPSIINNILVLSSKTGAAIHDFYYVLDNNKSKIKRALIDVAVQGNDCPKQISSILKTTDLSEYDLIVITRGGGSMEDLWGFNHTDIVESVYQCNKPVLSAIGHMVDTTLIDMVADITMPTPSLAAQFIVDHNKKYIDKLYDIMNTSKNNMMDSINKTKNNLIKMGEKLHRSFNMFYNMKYQLQNNIKEMINADILRLKIMDSKLEPEVTSITLYDNMNKINTPEDLEELRGNKIKLRWGDKEYTIKIY